MRKAVQFVALFIVIASTLSLSATVLDRPTANPQFVIVGTFSSAPDFAPTSLVRDFRPDNRTFTPDLCCDRPTQTGFTGTESPFTGEMLVNLDRPQFNSRFTFPQNPNAPSSAPEPGSVALLASGLLTGVYFVRRRK